MVKPVFKYGVQGLNLYPPTSEADLFSPWLKILDAVSYKVWPAPRPGRYLQALQFSDYLTLTVPWAWKCSSPKFEIASNIRIFRFPAQFRSASPSADAHIPCIREPDGLCRRIFHLAESVRKFYNNVPWFCMCWANVWLTGWLLSTEEKPSRVHAIVLCHLRTSPQYFQIISCLGWLQQ